MTEPVPNIQQTAILVGADTGEYDAEVSIDELEELARTAGAHTIAKVLQKRSSPDPATCVGHGKLDEIRDLAAGEPNALLIFDHELSASQLKNIEDATGLPVVDRTLLILDIFAQRAVTGEGKLQVELAQLRYRLPRLSGLGTSLSRLGGGIGTRGPGESKLESDRRHIRRRIGALEKQLSELERRRGLIRGRRKKDGTLTAAIVGYTNAGKSTLLNTLCGTDVLAQDMLFATLDPTARALTLPDGRTVILIDTVGLIRRLPHHLVEAFKSTLEEAAQADLLLNVCDASSPELEDQLRVTTELLSQLGAGETPVITVLNKSDKTAESPHLPRQYQPTVSISAKDGTGLPDLLAQMAESLVPSQVRMKLLVPYGQAGLLSQIRMDGRIFSERYEPDGIAADALVHRRILHAVEPFRLTQ